MDQELLVAAAYMRWRPGRYFVFTHQMAALFYVK